MKEIWVDVKGYEDLYQVSNLGRVKRVENKVMCSDGKSRTIKNKILKHLKNNSGYNYVNLYRNNKNTHKLVHRLVAEAFIPNQENKPCVNHIDGNKENNCVKNLEWCTAKENMIHAYNTGLNTDWMNKLKNSPPSAKKIAMYDLDMNKIKEFNSSMEAERYLKSKGISAHSSNIRAACTGINKTASGYRWEEL